MIGLLFRGVRSGAMLLSAVVLRLPRQLLTLGFGIAVGACATAVLGANPAATPPGTAPRAAAHSSLISAAQPATLAIDSIGVRSRLVDLGLNPDGTLQGPADHRMAGWYAAGPAPGQAGGPPAIIVGHFDSRRGPGVFYRLRELRAGDVIRIRGIDAVTRDFTVYGAATHPRAGFPAAEVYAPAAAAELRLITCSGPYDGSDYLSNLVVYARLAAPGG